MEASAGGDARLTCVVVVAGVVLVWTATYLAGGSKTALPHAFYLPVIVAAIRFGPGAALGVSIVAAAASGPLMPLDVRAGITQTPANWITRGLIFVLIGQITAYLVRHSFSSIVGEAGGRRLRRDLLGASERNQLRLDYQPIIDLRTGGIAGVEALVRWDHPDRGALGPDQFVSHAERAGCVDLITGWVLSEACRPMAQWRTGELSGRRTFTLAVNLSAQDLLDPSLPGHIGHLLESLDLPPSWLTVEITETALIDDIETAVQGVTALRSLGVRVAIDDFGAGESSLGQLSRLPVDVIKIDRSFLQQVEHQPHGETLITGITALARMMSVTTVVEGVETTHQAAIATRSRCDLAQGYLFAPPVDAGEFERLLANSKAFTLRTLATVRTLR